jgi:hypothetical protein
MTFSLAQVSVATPRSARHHALAAAPIITSTQSGKMPYGYAAADAFHPARLTSALLGQACGVPFRAGVLPNTICHSNGTPSSQRTLQAMPTQIKALPLGAARATRAIGMFAARRRSSRPLDRLARNRLLSGLRVRIAVPERFMVCLTACDGGLSEAAIESSPLTEPHSPITVTPAARSG